MLLIDTNILIYYLKGTEKVVRYFQTEEEIFISSLSKIELLGKKDLSNREIAKIQEIKTIDPMGGL